MTTIINGIRFACIPGGRFLMGSPNGTPFSRSNESPVCEAEVGSFFMWDDAVEFCRRLSAITDDRGNRHTFRLPTEAEWEYACRGGGSLLFGNRDSLTSSDANINGLYPINSDIVGPTLNRPCDVGRYQPNGFGLYDMLGNVWEWCADAYRQYGSEETSDSNAGVLRGGAWDCYSRFCRPAYRCLSYRDAHFYDCGFRIVCEPHQHRDL